MSGRNYVRVTEQRNRFCSHGADDGLTPEQVEFALALDRYKRERHRPFPTNSEILAVLLSLGYEKSQCDSQ